MGWARGAIGALAVGLGLGGCASGPGPVTFGGFAASDYAHWRCDAMRDEVDRVQQRAADVAYAPADAGSGYGVIAASHGVHVFWPALRAMHADGPDAAELQRLERRHRALQEAIAERGCAAAMLATGAQLAAMLPLSPGERLVYEERAGTRRMADELGLTLEVLRRGQLEFSADLAGRALGGPWLQDTAGNLRGTPASAAPGLLYWTRLLPREPGLGDVVAGELRLTGGGTARVRGQVVALGVHTALGRPFDAAVIELFGDVVGAPAAARVDGVLVVDRRSGVLLRLDLRSSDPGFSRRRTLVRIQGAG